MVDVNEFYYCRREMVITKRGVLLLQNVCFSLWHCRNLRGPLLSSSLKVSLNAEVQLMIKYSDVDSYIRPRTRLYFVDEENESVLRTKTTEPAWPGF